MKKSLKTLNVALACLMSIQVATIFAMKEKEEQAIAYNQNWHTNTPESTDINNNPGQTYRQVTVTNNDTNTPNPLGQLHEKKPVLTVKTPIIYNCLNKCSNFLFYWPKTTKTLTRTIIPYMMDNKKKCIAGAIAATSFITSAIFKSKKLAIWTGVLTSICAAVCLAKKYIYDPYDPFEDYNTNITNMGKTKNNKPEIHVFMPKNTDSMADSKSSSLLEMSPMPLNLNTQEDNAESIEKEGISSYLKRPTQDKNFTTKKHVLTLEPDNYNESRFERPFACLKDEISDDYTDRLPLGETNSQTTPQKENTEEKSLLGGFFSGFRSLLGFGAQVNMRRSTDGDGRDVKQIQVSGNSSIGNFNAELVKGEDGTRVENFQYECVKSCD